MGKSPAVTFPTVWEEYADAIPDVPAVICGERRLSWREYEDRAARVASALAAAGLGPDDKVGLYLFNSPEYLEAQFGAMKQRMVAVNVNFRYLGRELEYLCENAECRALFYHSSLADRVAGVAAGLPGLVLLVEVDDGPASAEVPGRVRYEDLVAAHHPAPRIERDGSDVYMLYTGGTTGMPKGVMYRSDEFTAGFLRAGAEYLGIDPTLDYRRLVAEVVRQRNASVRYVTVPCCPLMHGTGMWIGVMRPHCVGATVVLLQGRSFDADELLATVARERVNHAVIVGDAFARPIADALDRAAAAGRPYDTSSVVRIVSSGVMWTIEVKNRILDHIPDAELFDIMGSTEGGMGTSLVTRNATAGTAVFAPNPTTRVFDDDDVEVLPGDGRTGRVANGGVVPIGYYKDPDKSAQTFRTVGGVRYSFPGDFATFGEDGRMILLGRGSQVINTAGEKVFPEEVEEAVKRFQGVRDCLVVGLPDDKYGQRVVAVASLEPGTSASQEEVVAFVKSQLSGYKAPKSVVFVDTVPRAPNGKADYPGARALAEEGAG